MNDKTEDHSTAFPHKPLRDLFKSLGVREGDVGQQDLLVSWEIRSQEVKIQLLTEESKAQAIEDNTYKTTNKDNNPAPKHRHAILRKTDHVSPEFLVSWASVPGNAKRLAWAGSIEGGFYLNAKHRTENMLSASIPCPTSEQEDQLKNFSSLTDAFTKIIEQKRKLLDTQEKMLFAVHNQILSGKIHKEQAKEYFRQVLDPDYRAIGMTEQREESIKSKTPGP